MVSDNLVRDAACDQDEAHCTARTSKAYIPKYLRWGTSPRGRRSCQQTKALTVEIPRQTCHAAPGNSPLPKTDGTAAGAIREALRTLPSVAAATWLPRTHTTVEKAPTRHFGDEGRAITLGRRHWRHALYFGCCFASGGGRVGADKRRRSECLRVLEQNGLAQLVPVSSSDSQRTDHVHGGGKAGGCQFLHLVWSFLLRPSLKCSGKFFRKRCAKRSSNSY